MPELDLEAIEKRWKESTPGKWEYVLDEYIAVDHEYKNGQHIATWIAEIDHDNRSDLDDSGESEQAHKDGVFTANSHQDIPALIEEVRRLREEGRALKLMVVDMYYSGHRDGWMPGESTSETMDRAHDLLCNLGLDPYTNGGPEAIKKLREQNQ